MHNIIISVLVPHNILAVQGTLAEFTHTTLNILSIISVLAATVFIIRGGFLYITSSGRPERMLAGKRTIQLAIIGLILVLGANVLASVIGSFLSPVHAHSTTQQFSITPVQTSPDSSLAALVADTVTDFLKSIVISTGKPLVNGIFSFLTNTPLLASNSVIFHFWLIMTGITDSLFTLVVALLGFHVMSSSSFGFDELTLHEILPRLLLAFLAANISIFAIDWIIELSQTLISTLINSTGGLTHAWILDSFDPTAVSNGSSVLVTIIMMTVFVVLALALIIFYITRLMVLAFGAVMAPLVCLLWAIPRASGFAESAATTYLVTIFSLFIHVVIIQLASAFLTLPGQSGTNPFISVLIGIALLLVLLKSTSATLHMALTAQSRSAMRQVGSVITNSVQSTTSAGWQALSRRRNAA